MNGLETMAEPALPGSGREPESLVSSGGEVSRADQPASRRSVAHAVVNLVLLVTVALFAWVVYQEAFSAMPAADAVTTALGSTMHADTLKSVDIEGHDVVLVYDLTGLPYFDNQEKYAKEFQTVARVVLDEFRRVQRVRISILQGSDRYEGLSVTDGFGRLLEWL